MTRSALITTGKSPTTNSFSSGRALGLYWGAAAVAAVILSPFASEAAAVVPPCLFLSVTGLPCPTCGGTRAVLALSRLEIASALAFNPLVVAGCVGFVLGGVFATITSLAGRPLREPTRYGRLRLAALLAVSTNWIWLLFHQP